MRCSSDKSGKGESRFPSVSGYGRGCNECRSTAKVPWVCITKVGRHPSHWHLDNQHGCSGGIISHKSTKAQREPLWLGSARRSMTAG